MKFAKSLWLVLPLAFIATSGCIRSHRAPAVVYYNPAPAPTPTSERSAPRVYPEPVTPVPAPPPAAPPPSGVSANDVAIGESIRRLLKEDSGLAGVSGNVEATIDNGVITLRGKVGSEHDRTEIADRISRLPGVVRVDDQLAVEQR